jgi:hypothetical protein
MKRLLFIAALTVFAAPSFASVGVSVNIGEPGFYGQIDIGNYPQPRVVYAQPVIIQREVVASEPIYLRVPPGHRKNWKRYCGQYNACGRPVYFVANTWYTNEYAPRYRREHSAHDAGDRHDHENHGDDHDRRHDNGHDRGHGH